MGVVRNRAVRWALLALGAVSLITGGVGVFLPLLPTTPFILLAAWCFLRSSSRAHSWLLSQPFFGKVLKDWEERGSISRQSKLLALSTIGISLLVSWSGVRSSAVRIGVTTMLLLVSIFIVSRPER